MKAMLLAAGRGERMMPLTARCPKPLLEVKGRPLIEWQIRRLADAGVKEFVVNLHYLADQIKTFLGDGSQFGVSVEYSYESELLETAGGIHRALPLLKNSRDDGAFLVSNSDLFTDFDYRTLVARPLDSDVEAHLVMVPNPPHHPNGDFGISDEGLLQTDSQEAFTYSGISLFKPDFFDGYPGGKGILRTLLDEKIPLGKLSGELFTGQWTDVGTPERYKSLG